MSAEYFVEESMGTTPRDAWIAARRIAAFRWGHEGYTGSSAEKLDETPLLFHSTMSNGKEAVEHAWQNHADDVSIESQWEEDPVLCIPTLECRDGKRIFVFAGWASS